MTAPKVVLYACPQCKGKLDHEQIGGAILQTCSRCGYKSIVSDTPQGKQDASNSGWQDEEPSHQKQTASGKPVRVLGTFRRTVELAFKASIHAVRNDEGIVLEMSQAEKQLSFEYELATGSRAEYRLFVFEGADGGSDVEIRSSDGPDRVEREEVAARIMKEIGKYLLMADPDRESRSSRERTPRRERRSERDLPPRYRPPPLPYRSRPEEPPLCGLAVSGFVVSLCSLIFFIFISVPCAVVGLILSSASLTQTRRTSGQGFAIAGLVISLVTLAIWLILIVALSNSSRRFW